MQRCQTRSALGAGAHRTAARPDRAPPRAGDGWRRALPAAAPDPAGAGSCASTCTRQCAANGWAGGLPASNAPPARLPARCAACNPPAAAPAAAGAALLAGGLEAAKPAEDIQGRPGRGSVLHQPSRRVRAALAFVLELQTLQQALAGLRTQRTRQNVKAGNVKLTKRERTLRFLHGLSGRGTGINPPSPAHRRLL